MTPLDDFNLFKDRIVDLEKNPYYDLVAQVQNNPKKNPYDLLNKIRLKTVVDQIGVDESKVVFIRHEECHQYYGFYSQKNIYRFVHSKRNSVMEH